LRAQIRVSPRAARQIRAAATWWLKNRTAAAHLFADELDAAFALIVDLPFAGEAVTHARIGNLRRVLLGRTQHYLYYVAAPDRSVVDVLSLWHTSRERNPL